MEEHALSQSGPGLPPETWREQFVQVLTLSVPAILAQISSMAMQYIDAAMVGSLGARAWCPPPPGCWGACASPWPPAFPSRWPT